MLIGWSVLNGRVIGHIVGGHTVETVIGLVELFQAALYLKNQFVNDSPVESSIGVPGCTDTTGIVVCHRPERRSVVAIILLLINTYGSCSKRDGSV